MQNQFLHDYGKEQHLQPLVRLIFLNRLEQLFYVLHVNALQPPYGICEVGLSQ